MEKKRANYRHGFIGAAVIATAEILLFRGNRFVGTFFTPLVWSGYIIVADSIVAAVKGESPLTRRRKEFLISLPLSIIAWYVFEGVNLLLKNWTYVNLPEGTVTRWVGYAWSYATIFPAIFINAELIELVIGSRLASRRPLAMSRGMLNAFFYTGFILFVITLLFPSTYLCPLPWISVLLWFEGMNSWLGAGSFSQRLRKGDYTLFASLLVSGLVSGLLWEFWNYRALTKWHYSVPYLANVKLFEMPVLGFLGFPPFALECFLMYRFLRSLVPIRSSGKDALGEEIVVAAEHR